MRFLAACDNWGRVPSRRSFLVLSRPSLIRGMVLALAAFAASLRMGGFPDITALHASHWQIVPMLAVLSAMVDTTRCIGRKWTLYTVGVLILLYTYLMILGLAVLLFFFP